jgi:hypothetical protein
MQNIIYYSWFYARMAFYSYLLDFSHFSVFVLKSESLTVQIRSTRENTLIRREKHAPTAELATY